MAKGSSAGRYRRVAEGVYERNGSYYVPIWERGQEGKAKRVWHGPNCNGSCEGIHEPIVDRDSARDAKRALEAAKRKKVRGRKDETVRAWSERWLEVFPRKAQSTNLHNEERVRAFVRDFGDRSLRSLAGEREAMRTWALQHYSCVTPTRAMLNDAIKIGLLEENPLANLQLEQSRGRSDINVLSMEELARLAAVGREVHGPDGYGPVMAAMIEVAAWTGLRPGELFLLARRPSSRERTNWVDFSTGEVVVDWQLSSKTMERAIPKWDSRRRVVLLPEAERASMSLPDDGSDLPIFRTKRGSAYTQRSHHYYWDPVRKAFTAQLPAGHWLKQRLQRDPKNGDLDFYELRHFFGTMLAQPPEGVRPATGPEIALQMGHKDGGTLAYARYVHLNPDKALKSLRTAWMTQLEPGDDSQAATG